MKYNLIDLIKDIKIALNQNSTTSMMSSFGDVETLNLDKVVRSNIEDAARSVTANAHYTMLDNGKELSSSIGWFQRRGYGGGSIELPSDFLRLSCFQMSDWSRAVYVPISEDSQEYAMQSSRYPGIRGCPQKPVVSIVHQPVGLVLEFYSCTSGEHAYIKKARYIPIPKINGNEIEICEKLKPAVVCYTAFLVSVYLGEKDLSEMLLNKSKELMS